MVILMIDVALEFVVVCYEFLGNLLKLSVC